MPVDMLWLSLELVFFRGFTPVLKDVYNELKDQKKNFEVVFVSSDRDQTAFDVSKIIDSLCLR